MREQVVVTGMLPGRRGALVWKRRGSRPVTSNWQLVVSVLLAKGVRRSVFSVQYSVFSIQSFFAEDVLGARVILLSTHHSLDGTAISRNLEILDFRFSAIFNSRFSIVVYRFKRQIANGKRQNSIYH